MTPAHHVDESGHLMDEERDDEHAGALTRAKPTTSYASARDVPFRALCRTFERVQRERGRSKADARRRYRALDAFHDGYLQSRRDGARVDAFDAYRLLLPTLDKERVAYRLKHDALAKVVIAAFDMSRASADAKRLEEWKQQGAGNLPKVIEDVLAAGHLAGRENDEDVGIVTIGEVNESLDGLAASGNKEERAAILRKLFSRMDATQVKWVCAVILKETKIRMGDKSILRHFHRDAEDLFDWTCDLRRVCEDLPRRDVRLKREDIEVGQGLINPQLAKRQNSVASLFKSLKGNKFVIETKFDGERIQIHKDGERINYWTRNMNDFGPRGYDVMNGLFRHLPKRCILDGELLVWNKLREQWYPFGAIKNLVKAANMRKPKNEPFPLTGHLEDRGGEEEEEGADDFHSSKYAWYAENVKQITYGDLELVYVPFDILYVGDESIRHLKLSERHEKLREHVQEVSVACGNIKARILLALPESEYCWYGSSKMDVERALLDAVERGEEGLVVKDLEGEWIPGDRSSNWMKIKPDYLKTEDLDVLLIGGYYGAGELRGGKISQFLVGIIESTNASPLTAGIKIMSFCKVGTGISGAELDDLRNRLGDCMHREKPKDCNYTVTDAYSEKPDVWIWPPQRSVVVRIKGDIRLIRTRTFASGYSLRFPRVTGLRYDKLWSDIMTYDELKQTIEEDRPNIGVDIDDERGGSHTRQQKRSRTAATLLPSHLMPVNVSSVVKESDIFKGLDIHVVNAESRDQKQQLFHQVIARGGATSEFWHESVTHSIAANAQGQKYDAACAKGDVYTIAWLKECIREGRVIDIRPRHRLHLAAATWFGSETMDRYGDNHLVPCNEEDVHALLNHVGDQSKRWETAERPAIVELEHKYPSLFTNDKYMTFHGFVFEIDDSGSRVHDDDDISRAILTCERENMEQLLKIHGGSIASDGERPTHVVRLYDDSVSRSFKADTEIFSSGWVNQQTMCQI